MTKQPRAAQNIISYHLKQGRSSVGETQVIAWPSAGAGEKSSSKDAISHTTTQTGTPGGSTSAAAESSILLMRTLGCRTRWLKYLCPCHPMGDPGWVPGSWIQHHLGCKPKVGRRLFPSLCLSVSFSLSSFPCKSFKHKLINLTKLNIWNSNCLNRK